jgi:hypothetical protein
MTINPKNHERIGRERERERAMFLKKLFAFVVFFRRNCRGLVPFLIIPAQHWYKTFSLYIMASIVKDLDTQTCQTRNLKALDDAQLCD